MGLPVSDAIRLLMLRRADERRLPFDVHADDSRSFNKKLTRWDTRRLLTTDPTSDVEAIPLNDDRIDRWMAMGR